MQKREPLQADPIGDNVQLDPAVVASTLTPFHTARIYNLTKQSYLELPPNSKVLSVTPSGKSLWVGTVKIVVKLADGTTAEFFKKVGGLFPSILQITFIDTYQDAHGSIEFNMMEGTWEAENALYKAVPNYAPQPVGWGTYQNDPDTHFYLCEFIDMDDDLSGPRMSSRCFCPSSEQYGKITHRTIRLSG